MDSTNKLSRQRRSDSHPGFSLAQDVAVYRMTFSVMKGTVDRHLMDGDARRPRHNSVPRFVDCYEIEFHSI